MVITTDDTDFTDAFCSFLQRCVVNVDTAELLVLMARSPLETWSLQEATAQLAQAATITEVDVQRLLDRLASCGLTTRTADHRWLFRAQAPDSQHVATLARLYLERPVTLFRMIYALRDGKIKTFADAFKLRS